MAYEKGCISWNKGKKFSEKHKRNLRESHLGYVMSQKQKDKIREEHINNKKIKKTQFKKGQIPWNYIDGRSKILTTARYGDDWEAVRLLIYKRDNFTCQECGEKMSKFPFHIHHKIPFLISFDNSPKNLITLCPSCHRKVEAIIMRELKSQKVEV